MTIFIDGRRLAKWLASDYGRPEWLVGYMLDEAGKEWLITGIEGQRFVLAEIGPDGSTQTGKVRLLLIRCIEDDACVWSEADDHRVVEAVQSSLDPLDLCAERDFAYLLQQGWPGSRRLGMASIELASLIRRIGDASMTSEEIDRIAAIAETSKDSSLIAARWITRHLAALSNLDSAIRVGALLQVSSLYRIAGKYGDALSATECAETMSSRDAPTHAIAALMVTRAAAFMDQFEIGAAADRPAEDLMHAERLLKRAFALSGGRPSHHQKAAYGRLQALQRKRC